MAAGLFDENDDQATMIEKANEALGGIGSESKKEEEDSFSDEDLKIVEDLVFKGSAKKEFTHPRFKELKCVISTISPCEYDMIDSAIVKFINDRSSGEESLLNDNIVNSKRMSIILAVSLVSVSTIEFADVKMRLSNVSAAISKYETLMSEGNIKEASDHLDMVIKLVNERAAIISTKLSINVINWISEKRSDFETLVSDIMTSESDPLEKS